MPEGDKILRAANRIRPVLEGAVPDEILTPRARHARDGWPERLHGRAVTRVDTHGKHLFPHFDGDLVPRPRMRAATKRNRPDPSGRHVYDRAGRPCPRCGTTIRARGQGDDNRTTFWCPGCQR